MDFDMDKPVFILKQIYDGKTGNIYPAGDRPYNAQAIPSNFLTPEYCTQEREKIEKMLPASQTIEIRPLSVSNAETVKISASERRVIKESLLPPPPDKIIEPRSYVHADTSESVSNLSEQVIPHSPRQGLKK